MYSYNHLHDLSLCPHIFAQVFQARDHAQNLMRLVEKFFVFVFVFVFLIVHGESYTAEITSVVPDSAQISMNLVI